MKDNRIAVSFHTAEDEFAQVLSRALGPDFDLERQAPGPGGNGAGNAAPFRGVVLLDLRELHSEAELMAPLAVLEQSLQQLPAPPVIALITRGEHALTRRLIEAGFHDTLESPPDMVELRLILRRAHRFWQIERELFDLHSKQNSPETLDELLGSSAAMRQVFSMITRMAPYDVNVLITGESGTGKELVARAMHQRSPRARGPFVAFSCANLPEALVESELFGHERGAFTGAVALRRGRFETAEGGTLFLDEVGDLPLDLQAKLLRVLQNKSFERLGSSTPIQTNARVLCATNQDLKSMISRQAFREDLYYRLNVVQIQLPPLRERREEIPSLAYHFLRRFAESFGVKAKRISRLALHALEEHHWPGNVRELENVIQRAVLMAEGSTVEIWHLPLGLGREFEAARRVHSYEEEVRDFKRRLILRVLRECSWKKSEAARALGIARGYLHKLITQLHIQEEAIGTEPPAATADELPTGRVM
jgi:DNA-binding NtrC family response regulator